jgi:uncharacterized repeat protein (TIGR03803 family)
MFNASRWSHRRAVEQENAPLTGALAGIEFNTSPSRFCQIPTGAGIVIAIVLLSLTGGAGRVGAQTLTNLYSFTGGADGASPYAGLAQGSDGNLYGTAHSGNLDVPSCAGGCGTVFKISAAGALTPLYSFTGGADGGSPYAGLVQGSDGSFYGTAAYAGTSGYGTVFKISPSGGPLTWVYSFTGGADGAVPAAALVQGTDPVIFMARPMARPLMAKGAAMERCSRSARQAR